MPITTSGNGAVQYSIYKEFSPVVTSKLVMGSTSVDMAEGLGDIKQFIICYFFFLQWISDNRRILSMTEKYYYL